jgi:hypothetical protein
VAVQTPSSLDCGQIAFRLRLDGRDPRLTLLMSPTGAAAVCLASWVRLCQLEKAQVLVEAAELAGVNLMINFSQRWNPKHLAVKERIQAGDLGEILVGYARNGPASIPTALHKPRVPVEACANLWAPLPVSDLIM